MFPKFAEKFLLPLGVLNLAGLGILIGAAGAQATLPSQGIVTISTIEEQPKVLTPNDGAIRVVDRNGGTMIDASNAITARLVGEVDGMKIYSFSMQHVPDELLNIQSGALKFSVVSPEWYSAHWLVKESDKGIKLINRWKPAFAIGRKEDGAVTTMSAANDATLWKVSAGSSPAAAEIVREAISQTVHGDVAAEKIDDVGPPHKEDVETSKAADQIPPVENEVAKPAVETRSDMVLLSHDFSVAISGQMKPIGFDPQSDGGLMGVEALEEGVFRFFVKQGDVQSVMHIQNGELELSTIDVSWWSGQWVAEPVADGSGQFRLRNRWKPDIVLERSRSEKLVAGAVGPIEKTGQGHFWRILKGTEIVARKNAAEKALADDIFTRHWAANQAPTVLEIAVKQVGLVAESAKLETVLAAQIEAKKSIGISTGVNKPFVSKPQNEAGSVGSVNSAENNGSPPSPGAVVAVKAGVKETEEKHAAVKSLEKTEKKKEGILDKIHREITGNNNFTDSVGPFQTYLKLYANNLLGLNETIWVLGDAFALGKELKAFRTGFELPVSAEKDWFVRYSGHFSWLNPTPVDRDYQSLDISEQEHIVEFYHVTQTEGHRNETGAYFNYLNSFQDKLELNATETRELGFSSRDIGAFTAGNLWRENKATKDNASYRLSISKGLNVFGATREFAVRTEAQNAPLVVKGHFDARRYWKKSRWHVAAAFDFQWADRSTEWHKHFGLGGANYAPGFPAAEVAGEIGAGTYLEIGRAFDYEPAIEWLPETVTLTPYLRGDVAYVNSLFDNLAEPLEYARDGLFVSAKVGVRVSTDKWNFDVGYGLPVSGNSRFQDAREGRLSFTATVRW